MGSSFDQLPFLSPDKFPLFDHNFPSEDDVFRFSFDFPALIRVVVGFGVLFALFDSFAVLWIVDYEVGVASDGDRSLLGVESEDLCGVGAGEGDELL